jgi:predicted DsbA family dithiol-disulfide isomerase
VHARNGNSRDAHRVVRAALDDGGTPLQAAVVERFMHGYFTQREPIADPTALRRMAVEAGMEPLAVDRVLAGDEYGPEVAADLDLAQAFGITGVPFLVIDRRYGVSGAQPTEAFLAALRAAADGAIPV